MMPTVDARIEIRVDLCGMWNPYVRWLAEAVHVRGVWGVHRLWHPGGFTEKLHRRPEAWRKADELLRATLERWERNRHLPPPRPRLDEDDYREDLRRRADALEEERWYADARQRGAI